MTEWFCLYRGQAWTIALDRNVIFVSCSFSYTLWGSSLSQNVLKFVKDGAHIQQVHLGKDIQIQASCNFLVPLSLLGKILEVELLLPASWGWEWLAQGHSTGFMTKVGLELLAYCLNYYTKLVPYYSYKAYVNMSMKLPSIKHESKETSI